MDKRVNFPEGFFEGSDFEGFLSSPVSENVGIIATSDTESNNLILRLYEANKPADDNIYQVIKELAAFSFPERDQLLEFMEDLPKMSGIDMLLLLNKTTPSYQN